MMTFKIKNKYKKDIHTGDTISYYTIGEGWIPFFIEEINFLDGRVYGRDYGLYNRVYLFDLDITTRLFKDDIIRIGVHSGFKNI